MTPPLSGRGQVDRETLLKRIGSVTAEFHAKMLSTFVAWERDEAAEMISNVMGVARACGDREMMAKASESAPKGPPLQTKVAFIWGAGDLGDQDLERARAARCELIEEAGQ